MSPIMGAARGTSGRIPAPPEFCKGTRPMCPMIYLMNSLPFPSPTFLRLPAGAERCPWTGLTRGYLHDLCVPCARNNFTPPVESHLVGRGRRGVRLICFRGLAAHLAAGTKNQWSPRSAQVGASARHAIFAA